MATASEPPLLPRSEPTPQNSSFPASDPGHHSNPHSRAHTPFINLPSSAPASFTMDSAAWNSIAATVAGQDHDRGDSPMPDAHPLPDTPTIESALASAPGLVRLASDGRPISSGGESSITDDSSHDDEDDDDDPHNDPDDDHDMTDAPPPPPNQPPTMAALDTLLPPPPPASSGWNTVSRNIARLDPWTAAAAGQSVHEKHPWCPIYEDESPPGPDELKRVETAGEVSALDHEHWQKKAFKDLNDPEYTVVDSGRIEWTIKPFNGTHENPNKDLLMRSEPVKIAGHDWRIKLYPKGNGTSYLGAYLECLSFEAGKTADSQTRTDSEMLDTPLPLLNGETIKVQRQVPAQIMIIMYNPQETRVHFHKKSSHSFCDGDPDRGFSRFGPLPFYDLGRRLPDTRQAMLRNDTLGLIAHVRVYKDPTGYLFGREDVDMKKDFLRTGLRPLRGISDSRGYATNLASGLLSLAMLPPIRSIIYRASKTDGKDRPFIACLQELLCDMRRMPSKVDENSPYPLSSITMGRLASLIRWHGDCTKRSPCYDAKCECLNVASQKDPRHWHPTGRGMQDLDVFQVWDVLHTALVNELEDTALVEEFRALFGADGPRVRMPEGSTNIRQSLSGKPVNGEQRQHPPLLQVELPRQTFDEKSRRWKKLDDRIPLSDTMRLTKDSHGWYALYGLILHHGGLQSRHYTPILRVDGNKWLKFLTDRSQRITRLTKKQALTDNEANTYIAIYMRMDVAATQLMTSSPLFRGFPEESFEVPQYIQDTPTDESRLEHFRLIFDAQRPPQETKPALTSDMISTTPITSPLAPTPPNNDSSTTSLESAHAKPASLTIPDLPADPTLHELTYFSSGYYRGTLSHGFRHGHGNHIASDGTSYTGTFRRDARHGHGKATFPNGDTYDGAWELDEMHGQGSYVTAATGNVYEGGFREGKRHGSFTLRGKKAETLKGCLICFEAERDAVLYPCGHVCACLACARELETCPFCHRQVAEPIRFFLT